MSELEATDSELIRNGDAVAAAAPPGRREAVARGTIVNSAFLIGLGALNLLRAFVVAAFVTASEFGVWSILFLAVAFVGAIKAAAVSDKYVQQQEADQVLAFQKAFTLELLSALAMTAAMAVLVPLLVVAYGEAELLLPGLALSLLLLPLAMQAGSISVYYRRMDFLRQRILLSIDPIVGFAITVALAIAGAGYWSLVIGAVAGAWAGGLFALGACPYPLRMKFDRATLRDYFAFSWPLMLAVGIGLLMAQMSVFFGEMALGLAGAGAIGLAAAYQAYTDRVDSVISAALYPAICRVRDRRDVMLEAFIKSNRLALMWAVPFGIGLTLFAADLIEFGIGERWRHALFLIQTFGVLAAINHIGFNWGVFFRAIGDTRPIAIGTAVAFAAFCAAAVPLLLSHGLDGFAIGMGAVLVASMAVRFVYLSRLFPGLRVARHFGRSIAPTIPAVLAVLAVRELGPGERSPEAAVAELGLYLAVTIAATLLLERRLLREAVSYLRAGRPSRLRAT